MAVQKPVFMAWYGAEAAGAGLAGWLGVLLHGLWLDATVAGYVTALPLLITLLSFWVRFPERMWRRLRCAPFVGGWGGACCPPISWWFRYLRP